MHKDTITILALVALVFCLGLLGAIIKERELASKKIQAPNAAQHKVIKKFKDGIHIVPNTPGMPGISIGGSAKAF